MPRVLALILLTGALLAACAGGSVDEEVEPDCGREDVLLEEALGRGVPSTPFTVRDAQRVFASVVVDVDYNPGALAPGVATLYAIPEGAEPAIREDTNGLTIVDDPPIRYDREGQWRQLDLEAGQWRIWSRRSPEILVVACPA